MVMIKDEDRKKRESSKKDLKIKAKAYREMFSTDGYKYLKEEVEGRVRNLEDLNKIKTEDKTESEIASLVRTNQLISKEIKGLLNNIENFTKEVLKNGTR